MQIESAEFFKFEFLCLFYSCLEQRLYVCECAKFERSQGIQTPVFNPPEEKSPEEVSPEVELV